MSTVFLLLINSNYILVDLCIYWIVVVIFYNTEILYHICIKTYSTKRMSIRIGMMQKETSRK